jgi:hypothetical protein
LRSSLNLFGLIKRRLRRKSKQMEPQMNTDKHR